MLPGFHGFDLIIILAIVLLVFGPKKLPEVGSAIGKSIKEYRKSMKEIASPLEEEESSPALNMSAQEPEPVSARVTSSGKHEV